MENTKVFKQILESDMGTYSIKKEYSRLVDSTKELVSKFYDFKENYAGYITDILNENGFEAEAMESNEGEPVIQLKPLSHEKTRHLRKLLLTIGIAGIELDLEYLTIKLSFKFSEIGFLDR